MLNILSLLPSVVQTLHFVLKSAKHEDVYLNSYATMGELLIGLTKYFVFYNAERPHQSLGNKNLQEVHKTSSGDDAMMVAK